MKLEIPNYKPEEIYKHFMNVLTDEYEKLKKKYGVFPIIYGADEVYRLTTHWELSKMFPETHDTETFISGYTKGYNPRTFMATNLIAMVNNPLGRMVIQYIWVGHVQIVDRLFSGLNHLDVAEEFFRISLRHEYGHCLHNNKIFESTGYDPDKASQVVRVMMEDHNKGLEKLHNNWTAVGKHPDEEYYKLYHALPMEKEANELVGLTYRDHWNCLEILDSFD